MSKSNLYDEIQAADDIELLTRMIVIVNKILMDSQYMGKKPNNNTPYQEALAVQSLSAISFTLLLIDEVKNQDFKSITAVSLFLRSLIETSANISYFADRKDDNELAQKFLHTSLITEKVIHKIWDGKPPERYYWCDKSIAERIKSMDDKSKHIDYANWYFYLSSYVHADAGYLHSLPYAKSKQYMTLYTGVALVCMMELLSYLEEGGVLDKPLISFMKMLKEYLDDNKKAKKATG